MKYETRRKVRVRLAASGRYREYYISIPRRWVEAVAKEKAIEPSKLYLRLRYDGSLEFTPEGDLHEG